MPVALVFLIIIFASVSTSAASEYTYRSVFSLQPILSFELQGKLVGSGHTTYEWLEGRDEHFYFLEAPEATIQFAMPHQLPKSGEWSKNGVNYSLTTMGEACFLGNCYEDTYVVFSKIEDVEYTYLFSRIHGVVAISVRLKEVADMLVLQQHCGLGKSLSCVE